MKRVIIPNPRRERIVNVMCKIAIPEANLDEAIEAVRSWYGVHLRPSQLIGMARRNGSLARDLADCPSDTETRETIASETAKLVLGVRWPMFCDGTKAWTSFAKSFNALAAKKGVRLETPLDPNPPTKLRPRRMSRSRNAVPSGRRRVA